MKVNFKIKINHPENAQQIADIDINVDATPGEYITLLNTSRATVKDILAIIKDGVPTVLNHFFGNKPEEPEQPKQPFGVVEFLQHKFPGLRRTTAESFAQHFGIRSVSIPEFYRTTTVPSTFLLSNKINDIKDVKTVTLLGLVEAKNLVEDIYTALGYAARPPLASSPLEGLRSAGIASNGF